MRLAHDRGGDGPPLVLLHPLGADRRVWDPVRGLLATEREVIAVDLPGFGASPALPGAIAPTPRALAVAVRDFCEQELGLAGWHVAGNSLGGWVALELGVLGVVRSVTAIAPAGLWGGPLAPKPSAARRLARLMLPAVGPAARVPALRRLALMGSVAHPERVPPAAAAHLIRSYARAPGFPAANAAMRAGRFADLGAIDVPVTLVWPDHDRLIARPRTLAEGVREVVLADAGHIPMWDDPEDVALALLEGSAVSSAPC